jgi:hypothetical protein
MTCNRITFFSRLAMATAAVVAVILITAIMITTATTVAPTAMAATVRAIIILDLIELAAIAPDALTITDIVMAIIVAMFNNITNLPGRFTSY